MVGGGIREGGGGRLWDWRLEVGLEKNWWGLGGMDGWWMLGLERR